MNKQQFKHKMNNQLQLLLNGVQNLDQCIFECENEDLLHEKMLTALNETKAQLSKATNLLIELGKLPIDEEKIASCPHCGTFEMLCGHNGVGCSSERNGESNG